MIQYIDNFHRKIFALEMAIFWQRIQINSDSIVSYMHKVYRVIKDTTTCFGVL